MISIFMSRFFPSIIFPLIIGLLAGFLGAVLAQNELSRYAAELEAETARQLLLSEESARVRSGGEAETLEKVRAAILPALAIFSEISEEGTALPGSETGLGIVVTSDGWLVTVADALGSFVTVGDKTYPVEETVADPLTEIIFARIKANGLPVAPFGDSRELEAGEEVFAAVGRSAILSTTVVDPHAWSGSQAANSAERFITGLLLSGSTDLPAGAPIVNDFGGLIGIEEVPFHHFSAAVTQAVRGGTVTHTSLGAIVADLSLVRLSSNLSRGLTRGAYVKQVTYASPAALAGLVPGDVILRVQDIALDDETTLAEALVGFEPGKRVTMVVDRSGMELSLEVELGAL